MRFTPVEGQPPSDTITIRGNYPGSPAKYVRRRDKVYFIPPETPLLLGLNDAGTEYNKVLLVDGVREVSRDEIRQILALASDMI